MGRYVDAWDYEGDVQVAKAHGLIEDDGTIWVEDAESDD